MSQALDEDGHPIETTDFPYTELDQEEPLYSAQDFALAAEAFRRLIVWRYQDGSKNDDGVRIRNIIIDWFALKELHHLSMSQLARKHNLYKQSIGRWVDDFKRAFPHAKTEHMR